MRRIVLELAEDTSGVSCGDCDHALNGGQTCAVFGWLAKGKRHPHCLIAERTFSRLLDVSPEDARNVDSIEGDINCDVEALKRIDRAIRAHAKKAEVKP